MRCSLGKIVIVGDHERRKPAGVRRSSNTVGKREPLFRGQIGTRMLQDQQRRPERDRSRQMKTRTDRRSSLSGNPPQAVFPTR